MNVTAFGDDPERAAGDNRPRRPRNYLSGGERRRLFWRVMPPAMAAVLLIGWLEGLWNPRSGDGASARIDTRLASIPELTLGPGDVLVEQPAESEPVAASDRTLSAAPEALARIKDDSLHRSEELPAWVQTFLTLRSTKPSELHAAARPVMFGELFGQPRSFRGRAVRFSGRVHSLEQRKAPANDYGFAHYWESWIEPDGASEPIVVHALDVPANLRSSAGHPSVDVDGYFFKNLAYLAGDQQVRRAPLVLAATLRRRPPPTAVAYQGAWLLGYALLGVVVATVATVFGFGLGLVGPKDGRRPVVAAADLEATLAGADIVSPSEALQRLEADHRAADAEPSAGAMQPSP